MKYYLTPENGYYQSLAKKKKQICHIYTMGFPGGSDGKESACNMGDMGSIPGSGRSLGDGNGNPLQYFCLENFMYRGAGGLQYIEWQMSWKRLNTHMMEYYSAILKNVILPFSTT